jgi:RNA binding exosome subunit
MNHLTDRELIDYTLKFDTDPVRIRLAKVMDEMPGFILQRLEDVGMNPETCMFENCYDPGDYITHLETEVEWRDNDIQELQEKLREYETMTLLEFMESIKQKLEAEKRHNELLKQDIRKAVDEKDRMHSKLKTWSALNGSMHVKV